MKKKETIVQINNLKFNKDLVVERIKISPETRYILEMFEELYFFENYKIKGQSFKGFEDQNNWYKIIKSNDNNDNFYMIFKIDKTPKIMIENDKEVKIKFFDNSLELNIDFKMNFRFDYSILDHELFIKNLAGYKSISSKDSNKEVSTEIVNTIQNVMAKFIKEKNIVAKNVVVYQYVVMVVVNLLVKNVVEYLYVNIIE